MNIDSLSTTAAPHGALGPPLRPQTTPVHNSNVDHDSPVRLSSEASAIQGGGGEQVSAGATNFLGGLQEAFGAQRVEHAKSKSESKLIKDCEALMALIRRQRSQHLQRPDRLKDAREGRSSGNLARVDLGVDRSGTQIHDKGFEMVHRIKLGVSRVAAEYGDQGLPTSVSGLYEKTMLAAAQAGLG